jgi:hypothetical protein
MRINRLGRGYHHPMPKTRLLTLGAVVLTVLAPSAANALLSARPTLSLKSKHPIVVAGAHFYPREWVRVTAASHTARVRATAKGSFVVSFPGLTLGRCSGLFVRAAGTHGTVALWKLPQPACMPAQSP